MGIALVAENGALAENKDLVGAADEPPGVGPVPMTPVPNRLRVFADDELVGPLAPREKALPNTHPAPAASAAVPPNNTEGDEAVFTPEDAFTCPTPVASAAVPPNNAERDEAVFTPGDAFACPGPGASTAVPPNNADGDEAVSTPEDAFARLGMNRRWHCERPRHTSSNTSHVDY